MTSTSALSPRASGNCRTSERLARASDPEAQIAQASANVGAIASTSPGPRDAAFAKKAANRRPPAAPHPAKRGSDICSKLRRPSVSTRIPENVNPARNPSTPKTRGKGTSALMPKTQRGKLPAANQTAAQVKPIPIAPRIRRSHFCTIASASRVANFSASACSRATNALCCKVLGGASRIQGARIVGR